VPREAFGDCGLFLCLEKAMKENDLKIIEEILGKGSTNHFRQSVGQNQEITLFPELDILIDYQPSDRCSKSVKELRKNIIRSLMLAGIQSRMIIEYCTVHFHVSEKAVRKYITEINKEFEEAKTKDVNRHRAVQQERMENALAECIANGNMKYRYALLKELNDFHGLKIAKHEHSGPDGGPIAMQNNLDLSKLTTDELKTLVDLHDKAKRGKDEADTVPD
jgi:hypothetical protein